MKDSLSKATPSAPIPTSREVGPLAAFGDAQTGQLDSANADKVAIFKYDADCKTRDALFRAALTRRRKFLGIF